MGPSGPTSVGYSLAVGPERPPAPPDRLPPPRACRLRRHRTLRRGRGPERAGRDVFPAPDGRSASPRGGLRGIRRRLLLPGRPSELPPSRRDPYLRDEGVVSFRGVSFSRPGASAPRGRDRDVGGDPGRARDRLAPIRGRLPDGKARRQRRPRPHRPRRGRLSARRRARPGPEPRGRRGGRRGGRPASSRSAPRGEGGRAPRGALPGRVAPGALFPRDLPRRSGSRTTIPAAISRRSPPRRPARRSRSPRFP